MTKHTIKAHRYKLWIAMAALLLGLAAPAGSLLFRGLLAGPFGPLWIREEIQGNLFYYSYMAFGTPVVFAIMGLLLGHVLDGFLAQKLFLEALNERLKQQSIMDDLTGLYNHRHILSQVDKEIERARRYHHALGGMMIDLDDFKSVNDTHGHLAGDRVLREASEILSASVRRIDIVGRYGGDEFLILLPEANDLTVRIVADRIQKNLAQHAFASQREGVAVTASIGLFFFSDLSGVDNVSFIEKIDKALLKAKNLGKNRVFSVND